MRAVYLSGRRAARDGTACCRNWGWARSRSSSSPRCYGIRRLGRHGPLRRRRRSRRRHLPSRGERSRPLLWWSTWPELSSGPGCTHCGMVRGRPMRWPVPEACEPTPIRPASISRSEFPTATKSTSPCWGNVRPEAARKRPGRGSVIRVRPTVGQGVHDATMTRRLPTRGPSNRRSTSTRRTQLRCRPFRESGVRSPVASSSYESEPVHLQRWTSCSTSRG